MGLCLESSGGNVFGEVREKTFKISDDPKGTEEFGGEVEFYYEHLPELEEMVELIKKHKDKKE